MSNLDNIVIKIDSSNQSLPSIIKVDGKAFKIQEK